ncbi:MAG: hypothetical protein Q7T07_02000, partial [Burkholderiaceae bacterium]|nr:hypothetical protein [Burkholderiaceae bacterium]
MSLNRFVWQIYCESSSGKKALRAPFLRFSRLGRHPGSEGWRWQISPKIPVHLVTAQDSESPWENDGTVAL